MPKCQKLQYPQWPLEAYSKSVKFYSIKEHVKHLIEKKKLLYFEDNFLHYNKFKEGGIFLVLLTAKTLNWLI